MEAYPTAARSKMPASQTALERFSKYVQLKIYQLEVTFSVYIFTPMEKFVFYTALFLLISLTFIATFLYLPQHLAFLLGRAFFYMHGDEAVELAKEAVTSLVTSGTAGAVGAAGSVTATIVKEL